MSGTAALAATLPTTVTLPPTTVYIEEPNTDLIKGGDVVFTAPGNYPSPAGNAFAYFGADPEVGAFANGLNGGATAQLTYTIELEPMNQTQPTTPVNAFGPSVPVGIVMADQVAAPAGVGYADALIKIFDGPANALNLESCANGNNVSNSHCIYGGSPGVTFTTANFNTVNMVNLVPWAPYTVFEEADANFTGQAIVDPQFTAPAGYSLQFSPGVGSVPEPGTWAMMALGMGALGMALRRHGRGLGLGLARV